MLWASAFLSPAPVFFSPGNLLQAGMHGLVGLHAPVIIWAICLVVSSYGLLYLLTSTVLNTINANIYSLIDVIVSPLIAAAFGWII